MPALPAFLNDATQFQVRNNFEFDTEHLKVNS